MWKGGEEDRKCEQKGGEEGGWETVVKKPQKSFHCTITFRSHELSACQKTSILCSMCVCLSVCEGRSAKSAPFKSVWKACSAFPKGKPCFPCVTAWIIPPLRMHSHSPDSYSNWLSDYSRIGMLDKGNVVAFVIQKCFLDLPFWMFLRTSRMKLWGIVCEHPAGESDQHQDPSFPSSWD